MTQTVQFEKLEVVPHRTTVFQVEDGTIFYFERTTQRLFVKFNGKEIEAANMPDTNISTIAAFGNAIYFETVRMIYKAFFIINKQEINVTFHSNLMEDAVLNSQGLCTEPLDTDHRSVYRMCDDCAVDGVILDKAQAATSAKYIQERIHKGQLYCVKRSDWSEMELCIMGNKVIGVQLAMNNCTWHSFTSESSPYLYISNGHSLHILNMKTMERLPVLDFGNVEYLAIVGVINGKITATLYDGGKTHLISAKVPEGFYESKTAAPTYNPFVRPSSVGKTGVYQYRAGANTVNEDEQLTAAIAASLEDMKVTEAAAKPNMLDERIKQMEKELDNKSVKAVADDSTNEKYLDQALQKFEKEFQSGDSESAEDKKRREYEAEMSATINELINKNMELTQQIEELNNKNHESDDLAGVELAKLCERNSELIEKHKELETLNWELTNELDRTEDLNEELEAANDRLTKDKEELIKRNEKIEKEKTATINELEAEIAKTEEEIEEMNCKNYSDETDTLTVDDEIEELKRSIELVRKQNELMSNLLNETFDSSGGEEYEIIDDVVGNKQKQD